MMQLRKLLLQSTLFTALLTFHAVGAIAQNTQQIVPVRVDSSALVEAAMQENKGRATTNLEGNGGILRLTYQAEQALTIYMVPLGSNGRFVPTDFLIFTLPPTDRGTVEIDLTVSPGWSPRLITWQLNLLTKDEHSRAGFISIEFVPASTIEILRTIVRHIFTTEPYTPSSYHALHGYRVMSQDVSIVMGILLLIACLLTAVSTRKEKRLIRVIMVMMLAQALYGVRFGIDAIRFTSEHLSGYSHDAYDEAGSIYAVAKAVNSSTAQRSDESSTLFICRTGTNYTEKILRYFVYPTFVTSDAGSAPTADLVLAMDNDEWRVESKEDAQTLHCGDLALPVRRLAEFPDGSILFTLLR